MTRSAIGLLGCSLGPCSDAVIAGDLIVLSGRAELDGDTLADGVAGQTRVAIGNAAAVRHAPDLTPDAVVRCPVYSVDMEGIGGMTSLADWMGAADAAAPRQLLGEAAAGLAAAVKLRVEAAAKPLLALGKARREELRALAETLDPEWQAELFPGRHDEIWAETCPACGCRGFVTGEQTGEDISQEPDEFAIWEIVERKFVGEEFRCPTCDLSLSGSEELEAAGIAYSHEDRQEREMEYEPDHGND